MNSLITALEFQYVVDTHALAWYLKNDRKLTATAKQIFTAAEQEKTSLIIPAIVMAELYNVNKKHRIFVDFSEVFNQLKTYSYISFANFQADDVLDFDRDGAIIEIHDRIIVGVARRLNAPLITTDPVITASGLVRIIW